MSSFNSISRYKNNNDFNDVFRNYAKISLIVNVYKNYFSFT